MTDAAFLELRRLAALVERLDEAVNHLQRRQLHDDDRQTGQVLLPLAAEVVGERAVTVPELMAAALADRTPAGQALCETLVAYGSTKAIGRLLGRLDGVVLSGVRLVPAGQRSERHRWRFLPTETDDD